MQSIQQCLAGQQFYINFYCRCHKQPRLELFAPLIPCLYLHTFCQLDVFHDQESRYVMVCQCVPQVHELRANLTAAFAATAKAQQQADTAHAELAKLPSSSPAMEAELQELRAQLRSAQNLAAQHQQEAMLSRYKMAQYKSNCMAELPDGLPCHLEHTHCTPGACYATTYCSTCFCTIQLLCLNHNG